MIKVVQTSSLPSALNYAGVFCKQNKGQKIDIVVPDKLSLYMERFIFEYLHISASFDINISTLNRFAKRNNIIDKSKQISKLGSIILINKILNQNADAFKVLVSHNYSFSYAEEIYKTIYQLKASKIVPEEMLKFKSRNDRLTHKIQDLAIVYQQYEEQKAGLIDASDMFLLSAFNISQGRENHKILFVGFDDFTAIEYSLIEQLAKACEVSIATYMSNTGNKYVFNDEVRLQLKNIAYINGFNYEEIINNTENNNLKTFLQNNLFATNKATFCAKPEEIKIFSASSSGDEIEFVARDIKTKILKGEKFNNFGVAVFDLENKINKIEELFSKYEINYYIDSAMCINKSVYYKFLLSIFKFNLDSNNLEHIIDIISSPFFKLAKEEKRQLILELTKLKFKGRSLKKLKFTAELDASAKFLDKFLSIFSFNKNMPLLNLNEFLFNSLTQIGVDEIINELQAKTDLKSKLLLKKSNEEVNNLFEEVLKFYPDITAETFYEIFVRISQVVEVNNLPLTLDAVKVVDANNFVEQFDNLYLVNCTSLTAPSLKHDCGIILDAEIEELNFAHKLAPTIALINKLQRLRLFNTSLLFNKTLTISYYKTQSELIKELCSKITILYNGAEIKLQPQYKNVFVDYVALSKNDYLFALARCKENDSYVPNFNCTSTLPIFNINTMSASFLEHYFACPFYAFLNDLLKIRPRYDSEVMAMDIGNILHEIVYLYYKNNKQVGDVAEFIKTQVNKYLEKEDRLKINANSVIITAIVKEGVRIINGLDYIDQYNNFKPKYFEYTFNGNNALNLGDANLIGKVDRVDTCNLYGSSKDDSFRIIDYKTGNANANLSELYYGKKLQLFLYNLAIEKILNMNGVGSFYLPLHNKYEKKENFTYSLTGFYIKDSEIVDALDNRLQAGDKSDIVNLIKTTDGSARRSSEKVVSAEEFKLLKNYSKTVANQAVKEIKAGNIIPSPLEGNTMCNYCPYAHICLKKANNIKPRAKDEVKISSFEEEK